MFYLENISFKTSIQEGNMKSLFLGIFFALFVSGCSERVISGHGYSRTVFQCRLYDGTIIYVDNLEECKQDKCKQDNKITEEVIAGEPLSIHESHEESLSKEVEDIKEQYQTERCNSFRNSDPRGWCRSSCRKAYSDTGFCMLFDP
ncbi:hypothetical protein A2996_01680 [Candidatus Campbellbacteria bacterium RIFCSPLOWO2_01_FULL_34_15]|uniref:Uncharacterized protein n=1 Tax=Candidatus Campbellbacteria bacterium RIFCSPLOWO2_01_FULL_34_15 TaxID=1797579 RepID=A0A1F5EMG7_9BACT|nr:MAG: hypothetical protein A2996_01680 [Candidatus Campbellbacteria bacterium RIFCSPLOWO2_01_FULL_34_15]